MTAIRVGHLYPDYLNIYADRGNIAVFVRRAALRGHSLDVTPLGMNDAIVPGEHDLYYVGGGQDREQLLVADNLAAKSEPLRAAVLEGGAALHAAAWDEGLVDFVRLYSTPHVVGPGGVPFLNGRPFSSDDLVERHVETLGADTLIEGYVHGPH